MIKKNKIPKTNAVSRATVLLVAAAILSLLINISLTFYLGSVQSDVCPKSTLPRDASVTLSLVSVFLAIAAVLTINKEIRSLRIFIFLGIFMAVVGFVQSVLMFASVGGLDFCTYLGA